MDNRRELFENVHIGEQFEYNGDVYIKTGRGEFNAKSLTYDYDAYFSPKVYVSVCCIDNI